MAECSSAFGLDWNGVWEGALDTLVWMHIDSARAIMSMVKMLRALYAYVIRFCFHQYRKHVVQPYKDFT